MTKAPENMTDQEQLVWSGLHAAMELAHKTAFEAGWYKNPETGESIERSLGGASKGFA